MNSLSTSFSFLFFLEKKRSRSIGYATRIRTRPSALIPSTFYSTERRSSDEIDHRNEAHSPDTVFLLRVPGLSLFFYPRPVLLLHGRIEA